MLKQDVTRKDRSETRHLFYRFSLVSLLNRLLAALTYQGSLFFFLFFSYVLSVVGFNLFRGPCLLSIMYTVSAWYPKLVPKTHVIM